MIDYISSPETPGIILKPTDTESEQFKPEGSFLLFVSGPVAGMLDVYGIPTAVLEDDDITDKTNFWTPLEAGDSLDNTDKVASYKCTNGLTIEVRPSQASTCYVYWGYAHQPVWVSHRGGI